MSQPPPTSAGLGWLQASSSWFRQDYDVIGRVFLVAASVRAALAVHTVVMNLTFDREAITDLPGMILAFVILLGWTVLVTMVLRRPNQRSLWVYLADTAVTSALILVTPLVVTTPYADTSLAGYWMLGCCLYAAVLRDTVTGVASAVLTSMTMLALPPKFALPRVDLALGAVLITMCTGLLITQFKHTITEQERARIRSVALGERERLARIVHDGTLQVLALVEREGRGLGPRGERLATLARQSESQLRRLIRDQEVFDETTTCEVDLTQSLNRFESPSVTVSTMAGEVRVARLIAEEVEASLGEALKNVEKHAGEGAKVWVLLDQEDDHEVILWIRDDGVGMDPAEMESAAERGRLGVRNSIVGRMEALGGSAVVKSSPGQGTEWELRFPMMLGEK